MDKTLRKIKQMDHLVVGVTKVLLLVHGLPDKKRELVLPAVLKMVDKMVAFLEKIG